MIALNHILVATDFSEPANVALAYGRELARRFGATLHVLHVVEDLGARFVEVPLYPVDLGLLQTEAEATARCASNRCCPKRTARRSTQRPWC